MTLGEQVDKLIKHYKKEAHLQVKDLGLSGSPQVFIKRCREFKRKIENLIGEYSL